MVVPRTLTLSIDQLYRRQPGGIATYVRGLVLGLRQVDHDLDVLALAPRGEAPLEARELSLSLVTAPLTVEPLTRLWRYRAIGVPRQSNIVHATSMAGPYGGGVVGAVHSVAMHDVLWRDEPNASTSRGVRFHENRLQLLKRRDDLRIFTSSPGLRERLIAEGIDATRVHAVRLGVDDGGVEAADARVVHELLAQHVVSGPFTLYVGTREPRKNLARLIDAHREARGANSDLGPLVVVGPAGWGGVDTGDATVLGSVARDVLKGLYREATVVAYVARAEGWGLPPVEALHAGTRVVASTSTPSVANNPEVIRVDPLDVASIAQGLLRALEMDDNETGAAQRRDSVATLTWANSALDHLAGWQ
jgi:glycosyltransferase involved in cell wall biosynthesis